MRYCISEKKTSGTGKRGTITSVPGTPYLCFLHTVLLVISKIPIWIGIKVVLTDQQPFIFFQILVSELRKL